MDEDDNGKFRFDGVKAGIAKVPNIIYDRQTGNICSIISINRPSRAHFSLDTSWKINNVCIFNHNQCTVPQQNNIAWGPSELTIFGDIVYWLSDMAGDSSNAIVDNKRRVYIYIYIVRDNKIKRLYWQTEVNNWLL